MSITPEETIKILTAKAECMRRETSGIDIDCNYRNCDECNLCYKQGTTGDQMEALRVAISALQAQNLQPTCNNLATDTISRTEAIDALKGLPTWWADEGGFYGGAQPPMTALLDPEDAVSAIANLPSAQPEQRYTEEELRVFAHGISLSLLSKRSAQRWQYDEDTATEIKFLERLYEKVGADMRGEQDG